MDDFPLQQPPRCVLACSGTRGDADKPPDATTRLMHVRLPNPACTQASIASSTCGHNAVRKKTEQLKGSLAQASIDRTCCVSPRCSARPLRATFEPRRTRGLPPLLTDPRRSPKPAVQQRELSTNAGAPAKMHGLPEETFIFSQVSGKESVGLQRWTVGAHPWDVLGDVASSRVG